jgi:RNA-directed DNA polymerase
MECALAYVGGNWNNGSNAGLTNWNLNNSSSNTNMNMGGQTLIRIY